MSRSNDATINITLTNLETGQSDSIPIAAATTTLVELAEWAKALLGFVDTSSSSSRPLILLKDGKPLPTSSTMTAAQAGIRDGDLIAATTIMTNNRPHPSSASGTITSRPRASSTRPGATTSGAGGLDFSSLLNSNSGSSSSSSSSSPGGGGGGLNFSSLLASSGAGGGSSAASVAGGPRAPFYYQGMNLEEAMQANPHPETFVQLLYQEDLLWKELNYYQPTLANEMKPLLFGPRMDLSAAAQLWRKMIVSRGIQSAVRSTEASQTEARMKAALASNPNDPEAKEYFQKKENEKLIQQQYFSMLQEYPESMGRVLMLYINAKVNGVPIQAFVDSGAQSTIMSLACAKACGIDHLIDTRFKGVAVGVGTGKIMGRVHLVGLEIGNNNNNKSESGSGSGSYHFPCTITVMESMGQKDMDFLLGLDMLKRHNGMIDLEKHELRFKISTNEFMSTPFLHEKDLDVAKGGTKGFDANEANAQVAKELAEAEKNISDGKKKDDDDDDDDGNGNTMKE